MTARRILVTGASGFVGRHVLPVLEKRYPNADIIGVNSKAADLTFLEETLTVFKDARPDCVVNLSSFGTSEAFIRKWPSDSLYQNSIIYLNVYEAARLLDIRKIVSVISGSVYPSNAPPSVTEADLWSGPSRADYMGYSLGKRMACAAADVYHWQAGTESTVAIVSDMYGDNVASSQLDPGVVVDLVSKVRAARMTTNPVIDVEGDPEDLYQLTYVGDVAGILPSFIEGGHRGAINVASTEVLSLKRALSIILEVMEIKAAVRWQPRNDSPAPPHILDVSVLESLGLACETKFAESLERALTGVEAAGPRGPLAARKFTRAQSGRSR